MYLKRNCLGVEILDLNLNSPSFFPGNDTTDAELCTILQRNRNLPRHGYAASVCKRGYGRRTTKLGILLREYEFDKWRLNITKRFFIETEKPISEEEMQNGKLEELVKKNKHKSIPLEQFGKYEIRGNLYEFKNSPFDHENNESCQIVSGIREILNRGEIIKDESKSPLFRFLSYLREKLRREIRIRIFPEQLTRIYPNSDIPYTKCETREFCGFCYLLKYGMEKIDYIKAYMENNGIGTINYIFPPPLRPFQLEVRIRKSWLNSPGQIRTGVLRSRA